MKRFEGKDVEGVCKYDLPELPANVKPVDNTDLDATRDERKSGAAIHWGRGTFRDGSKSPANPPAVGARVKINFNGLGAGVVESYFFEHGFLGVCVKLDAVPDWKRKQEADPKRREVALVFGPEISAV